MRRVGSPIFSPVTAQLLRQNENHAKRPEMRVTLQGEWAVGIRSRQMTLEKDIVYLGRRASEERRAAGSSDSRAIRDLHLEFASAYEFRLHLLREQAAIQAAKARAAQSAPAILLQESTQPAAVPNEIIIEV